jgi:hypothetical protein
MIRAFLYKETDMGVGVFCESFDGFGETFIADTMDLLGHTGYEAELIERMKEDGLSELKRLADDDGSNLEAIADLLQKAKAVTIRHLSADSSTVNNEDVLQAVLEAAHDLGVEGDCARFDHKKLAVEIVDDAQDLWGSPLLSIPATADFGVIDGLRNFPQYTEWSINQKDQVWDDFLYMLKDTASEVGGLHAAGWKEEKEMWITAEFGGPYNWLNIYVKQWEGYHWIIGVAPQESVRDALMELDESDKYDVDRFIDQWSLRPNVMRNELDKGVQLMLSALRLRAKACGFEPKYRTSGYTTDSYTLPEGQHLTRTLEKAIARLQKWNLSLAAKIEKANTRAMHLRFA